MAILIHSMLGLFRIFVISPDTPGMVSIQSLLIWEKSELTLKSAWKIMGGKTSGTGRDRSWVMLALWEDDTWSCLWWDLFRPFGLVRKAGGSLLVAYCSLAVACCLLFVSQIVGAQLIHFVVFPVSNAKDSWSMIITVIIGHLPNRCSSTTTRHYVLTAHPNSVHISIIFVRLHTSFLQLTLSQLLYIYS